MPELRRDPVNGRWVIISTERGKRPSDYPYTARRRSSDFCPFCPGNEAATPPEVAAIREEGTRPDAPGWKVRAVPNKFPALRGDGDLNREGVGIYDKMNGVGAHEVIIESPDHNVTLADLDIAHVADVLAVCQQRVDELMKDSRFRYAMLFKNQGESAGASLEHSHFQVIATPVVPKRVIEELEGAHHYFVYKERCIFCDIIRQELGSRERVVEETNSFVGLAPFASRFPYEVWILPKPHQSVFHTITEPYRLEFAKIIVLVLQRLKFALNDPAYNVMFHVAPFGRERDEEYHWHVEIIPKLTRVAGFEWGTGLYINPTSPEESAEVLRAVNLKKGARARNRGDAGLAMGEKAG